MRYNKQVWGGVWKYTKLYLFIFLFTYFAADVWRLATGDLRPLRKKGIFVEWLVHSKMEQCDSISNLSTNTPSICWLRYGFAPPSPTASWPAS